MPDAPLRLYWVEDPEEGEAVLVAATTRNQARKIATVLWSEYPATRARLARREPVDGRPRVVGAAEAWELTGEAVCPECECWGPTPERGGPCADCLAEAALPEREGDGDG